MCSAQPRVGLTPASCLSVGVYSSIMYRVTVEVDVEVNRRQPGREWSASRLSPTAATPPWRLTTTATATATASYTYTATAYSLSLLCLASYYQFVLNLGYRKQIYFSFISVGFGFLLICFLFIHTFTLS